MKDVSLENLSFILGNGVKQKEIHQNAIDHGWWEDDGPMKNGVQLVNIHGEVSEAVEALRDGNPESEKIPGFSHVEEEMADIMIRVMDLCEARGWKLSEAIVAKHEFNKGREYKHGGKLF